MKNDWSATIQGGFGPDVWTTVIDYSAADFRDAANIACGRAEEMHGDVIEVSQNTFKE